MRKRINNWGLSVILLLLLIFIISSSVHEESHDSSDPALVFSPYEPEKLSFCEEEVPLEYFDVFESLERELIVSSYFHSQTLLTIKKSQRYFPTIEPILKKNNIPDDFKYLAVAESGLSNVVSPKGARGFWQILEGTARDYGLEVNNEVDERYHLEKATQAACKYLQDSYKIYENWTMVAATYNAGRRGIERQVTRQGENDYYNLLLNEETARYVFRILAIKTVFENPERYGFILPDENRYSPVPHNVISISDPIENIGEFARQHNTNYKLLKFLNPWLRDNTLQNKLQKKYIIKIPTSRNRIIE